MPSVEVHILSHDDERMIDWSLRHYATFATKVVLHDGGPTNFLVSPSMAAFQKYAMEGWVTQPWDTAGQLNDELARKLKNDCWHHTDADWVICVDADELLYFPEGAWPTLEHYDRLGAAVPRPTGFEMFSEEWYDPEKYAGAQIYDLVKQGAPENKWYAKPALFSPKRVADQGFGVGAHHARSVLKDGRVLNVMEQWPFADPPCQLLHFHQIGLIEMIAARYDATRKRLAAINERNLWGNFKPGLEHAQEKRALILPNLRQVVP